MSAGPAELMNVQRGELTAAGWSVVYTYQVFTTDGTDPPDVVLSASGLPAYNSALSYDPLSRASRITPIKQDDATNHWHVDVEYSRETANQEDRQQPPTLRPVKRSASVRWTQRALMQDEEGDPIITSAKTPFDPPLEIAIPHPVVRFTRWESSFSTSLIKTYVGKVNSSTFGAYEPGWVMCTNIEASEEWEQDADGNPQKFWTVTYEFEACYDEQDTFRPLKILDADLWFIDSADSNKRKMIYVDAGTLGAREDLSADAVPIPKAIPLTSTGAPIAAAGLPAMAHYLEFNIYGEADFNALGLPVD